MTARHRARRILTGRREVALLALPSVARMAETLARRCREPSWVRTTVASLTRFAEMTGADLEGLLAAAARDPECADRALAAFADRLAGYTQSQVAALAIGPKLWFTLNGITVRWRPLPGAARAPVLSSAATSATDRFVLLCMIGSGLQRAELLRLNVGDVGSLDANGALVPDTGAEPLALEFESHRGGRERNCITFLTLEARDALRQDLALRAAAGRPA
ncbi:MAG: hypothetical protein ACREM6_16925, partial [Vulcanimicrobiaceae bacterium]